MTKLPARESKIGKTLISKNVGKYIPSAKTGEETRDTELTAHLDQSTSDSFARESFCLVDLGQQGIGRLGDNSSSETSNKTRPKVEGGCFSRCQLAPWLAIGNGQLFLNEAKPVFRRNNVQSGENTRCEK